MKFFKIVFAIAIICNTQVAYPQNNGTNNKLHEKIKIFEIFLHRFQTDKNIPSVSFAIVKDQQLVYSNAFGYADIEKKIPATDSTIYSIASLTKPLAATLILKLQEDGKININGKMRDYWRNYDAYFTRMKEAFTKDYPQFMPYIENYRFSEYDITVKHHLTHTSEGVPGTRFKYNGYLYGRLVSVIDNVVPEKFIGLMDSLFKKLNMRHSFLQYSDLKNSPSLSSLAKPYAYSDGNFVEKPFPDPQTLNAGAGLICSVKDLAKFDIAFDKNELISAKTKELMLKPTKGLNGETFQYGLGWFITTYHKQPVIYHYGLQESYSAFYLKLLQENTTLIILTNSTDFTGKYSDKIMNTRLTAVPYAEKFLELFADHNR